VPLSVALRRLFSSPEERCIRRLLARRVLRGGVRLLLSTEAADCEESLSTMILRLFCNGRGSGSPFRLLFGDCSPREALDWSLITGRSSKPSELPLLKARFLGDARLGEDFAVPGPVRVVCFNFCFLEPFMIVVVLWYLVSTSSWNIVSYIILRLAASCVEVHGCQI
jgi:hypothetical protein